MEDRVSFILEITWVKKKLQNQEYTEDDKELPFCIKQGETPTISLPGKSKTTQGM